MAETAFAKNEDSRQSLFADYLKIDQPYDSQWELMRDFMTLLDVRIYYLYKYHMWVGPQNNLQNMMGLVVSREEFEANLSKAVEGVIGSGLADNEAEEIEAVEKYFQLRLQKTEQAQPFIPAVQVIQKFNLDPFECNCLLLGFAVHIEKKYEKLFAYLQDDITKKDPTAETAIRIFAVPGALAADYYRYFTSRNALEKFFLENCSSEPLFNLRVRLRRTIAEYLLGTDIKGGALTELFDEKTEIHSLCVGFDAAERIDSVLSPLHGIGDGDTVILYLQGKPGSGRKFILKHAVRKKSGRCLFVNVKALIEAPGEIDGKLNDIICEALLQRAYLCFCGFEDLLSENETKLRFSFLSELQGSAKYLGGTVFVTSVSDWKDTGLKNNFVKVDIDIEELGENDRLAIWSYFTKGLTLDSEIDLAEIASKFNFTPGQIKNSVEQAAGLCGVCKNGGIDTVTLHSCCYAQVVMRLDNLAARVKPAYFWSDLILPDDQTEMLKEACSHVKYRHIVFQEWGFGKKISYGNGLSMLFSGPPGTGKTMAAQVIANFLHMEMYKIQLSQVVSKYIGETEKNLRVIFNEAKNANCILFFDETDALFGKRSEVKDSNDRHSNIEIAYLLQQMEEFDGVLIMATNLLQNIDAAFMRRINFVIAFPFPDAQTRLRLWQKLLETRAPISDDVNLEFLARQFVIAGGNIKNIVLHAAFLAAAQKSPIKMEYLLRSAVNEQRKNNIIVVKEDLKEYSDLIF